MRPEELSATLASLSHTCRYRQRHAMQSEQGAKVIIDGQRYLSFASNDYLGLAGHPAMMNALSLAAFRWGVGSGASHLVAGHFAIHDEVELALARFVGCEAALLFSSGYAANLAVISSLLKRGDAIFADRLNHASLVDACIQSRATFRRFRHNDVVHLEQLLDTTCARTRLIAVEAVYSMDGDMAPLQSLLALAEHYNAWLLIDDAHGFGVLGEGRGSLATIGSKHHRVLYMATLGKAAGTAGAFVAGSHEVIDWFINTARSYIYTTALSPALAATILTSLSLMESEPWRSQWLVTLIHALVDRIRGAKLTLLPSQTPIQPIIIGTNTNTVNSAMRLREQGIWVPAIRPPTVAEGAARLRISLTAQHSIADIDRLVASLICAV